LNFLTTTSKLYLPGTDVGFHRSPGTGNPNGQPNPNGQYSKFTYVQKSALINGGEFNLDIHFFSWLHFANSLTLTYGTNLGGEGKMHE